MIIFNECRIDDSEEYLIIDASIEPSEEHKEACIAAIKIDTQKTYSEHSPSDKAFEYVISGDLTPAYSNEGNHIDDKDIYCYIDDCNNAKHIRMRIHTDSLGFSLKDNMLFVYVITTDPSSDYYGMTVVSYLRSIYNKMIRYIKELNIKCSIPKGFIDTVLRYKAYELALKTGHYIEAINQWKLLTNTNSLCTGNKCMCNGIK